MAFLTHFSKSCVCAQVFEELANYDISAGSHEDTHWWPRGFNKRRRRSTPWSSTLFRSQRSRDAQYAFRVRSYKYTSFHFANERDIVMYLHIYIQVHHVVYTCAHMLVLNVNGSCILTLPNIAFTVMVVMSHLFLK